ncbi:MAG: glycerol kinase GlpK [Cyclobacteriaceae bacterium]
MARKYIVAFDQGTTSSRAVLFDEKGSIVGVDQREFTQIFPKAGWVEHDPMEIWKSQMDVFSNVLKNNNVKPGEVVAIGITNQRETTVVWDKNTGEPVYNAIVWQDKRTSGLCDDLKKEGLEEHVKKTTGLVIDSYFSATKINWILENVEGAKADAAAGNLLFGTIDSWLIWNMTYRNVHVTDYTNASRTMIFDISTLEWDEKMLTRLAIPKAMLPEVKPSSYHYGDLDFKSAKIPIMGIAGDQQAALFGQACFEPGTAKNTYGTGCFMLMNTGEKLQYSKNGLLTTMAATADGTVHYALEGSIFIAGAAIQWLRDSMKMLDSASDSEYFASKAGDSDEVYVVPAFAGLGAPYWDMYSRGAIFGLTRDSGKNHIIKATLESLAYQTKDVLLAMQEDSGIELTTLKVDGGACANNMLMQFQSDILGASVERPEVIESTAMGAAYLAGIKAGIWEKENIMKNRAIDRTFTPEIDVAKRNELYAGWKKAVERTLNWLS